MIRTEFWRNPVVLEEMTPEDKYFYLYLKTNPSTTQIGIYKITKMEMALQLGYSIESVQALLNRFINYFGLIRYNSDTRELAIKDWGKENLNKGGKPVIDCIISELKEVTDTTLIEYVAQNISKEDIRALYYAYCNKIEDLKYSKVQDADLQLHINEVDEEPYIELEWSIDCNKESDINSIKEGASLSHITNRGQKEKQNEKQKEKQQQVLYPNLDRNLEGDVSSTQDIGRNAVKEIISFWDQNGFGFSNMSAKQQLLSWLDDSNFVNPKDVILKALEIACANNKRRLKYVEGILKNWENESLLTIEEINSEITEKQAQQTKEQIINKTKKGRDIPTGFKLDYSAGEN